MPSFPVILCLKCWRSLSFSLQSASLVDDLALPHRGSGSGQCCVLVSVVVQFIVHWCSSWNKLEICWIWLSGFLKAMIWWRKNDHVPWFTLWSITWHSNGNSDQVNLVYRPHTDHATDFTDHIPTTYQPHTNHIPTTYQPHTCHIPATYQPHTSHVPTTIPKYRTFPLAPKGLTCLSSQWPWSSTCSSLVSSGSDEWQPSVSLRWVHTWSAISTSRPCIHPSFHPSIYSSLISSIHLSFHLCIIHNCGVLLIVMLSSELQLFIWLLRPERSERSASSDFLHRKNLDLLDYIRYQ